MADLRHRGSLHESFDRFTFESGESSITQCRFDFALTILVSGQGGYAELRIESKLELAFDGADAFWISPDGDPLQMAPALRLLRRRVLRLSALKTGEIEIECEAARVWVPSASKFEAWTLNTEDGGRLVSVPGGELAVWLPDS